MHPQSKVEQSSVKAWQVSDFDFKLPPSLIAHKPAQPRDSARLLVWPPVVPSHHFSDLPKFLKAGDLLVFNNTRVLPARLTAFRTAADGSQAEVEVLLHRCRGELVEWSAFCRPARKLKDGMQLTFAGTPITARVSGRDDDQVLLTFEADTDSFKAFLEAHGQMPLPPYIERPNGEEADDRTRYQTVYAKHDGSVAAPTAGLHFTPELLQNLRNMGVNMANVTLHVGAGTFMPVRVDSIADHKMHAEWGEVSAETVAAIEATKANGGRVICVGTTSLRLVESAARGGKLAPFSGDTAIFITPGFHFNVADGLVTNFHLPKSTLLMLVAAFTGFDTMKSIYQHAIAEGYRFYSYGDSSLLWRHHD